MSFEPDLYIVGESYCGAKFGRQEEKIDQLEEAIGKLVSRFQTRHGSSDVLDVVGVAVLCFACSGDQKRKRQLKACHTRLVLYMQRNSKHPILTKLAAAGRFLLFFASADDTPITSSSRLLLEQGEVHTSQLSAIQEDISQLLNQVLFCGVGLVYLVA